MSLQTGAKKGWWGPCTSMRCSREVSMKTLCAGTSPASCHHPAPSHWRNVSGNTYLTQYLTGSDFQQGWEGQDNKFSLWNKAEQTTKKAKHKQMVNKADSSAQGNANPCCHLACIFAGCIDSRLTLPKLQLSTYKKYIYNKDIISKWMQGLTWCWYTSMKRWRKSDRISRMRHIGRLPNTRFILRFMRYGLNPLLRFGGSSVLGRTLIRWKRCFVSSWSRYRSWSKMFKSLTATSH